MEKRKESFITKSFSLDILIIFLILFVLFFSFDRIKVYNTFTIFSNSIFVIKPDGSRSRLENPGHFNGQFIVLDPPRKSLKNIEKRIRNYVKGSGYIKNHILTDDNASLEWVVNYSHNNKDLDKKYKILFNKNSI